MSLILGCIDSDASRRDATIASLTAHISAWPGMRRGTFSTGELGVAWGAPPTAPVESHTTPEGRAAFVLGALTDAREQRRNPASYVLDRTAQTGSAMITGLNGYYLAALREHDGSVWLGTDVLGFYPLYWWTQGEVLVFTSAPGLIRGHPLFSPKPSAIGIAGTLMTMHPIDNQTIWEGVRRLSAGSALQWRAGHGTSVRSSHSLQFSLGEQNCPREEAVELLHQELNRAVSAATQEKVSIMLSGGLDSRLVAACSARSVSPDSTCVTFGRRGDFELYCAKTVARHLGFRHQAVSEDLTSFPHHAALQCALERSSSSFVNLAWWAGKDVFAGLGRRVLTGYAGDVTMGVSHAGWAWNAQTRTHDFTTLWGNMRRYGLTDHTLDALLDKKFFGDAAIEVTALARKSFDSLPGPAWQKAWMFDLLHRQRYHTSAQIWRLSFAAWPEVPFADLRLLQTVASLPFSVVEGRRAQHDLFLQKYPALTHLPLDNNLSGLRPHAAPFSTRAFAKFYGSPWVSKLVFGGRERRTYHRVYDINNRGWSAVRQQAEPARARLTRWFQRDALDRILPPAGRRLSVNDATVDGSGPKTLLGLALSLADLS